MTSGVWHDWHGCRGLGWEAFLSSSSCSLLPSAVWEVALQALLGSLVSVAWFCVHFDLARSGSLIGFNLFCLPPLSPCLSFSPLSPSLSLFSSSSLSPLCFSLLLWCWHWYFLSKQAAVCYCSHPPHSFMHVFLPFFVLRSCSVVLGLFCFVYSMSFVDCSCSWTPAKEYWLLDIPP